MYLYELNPSYNTLAPLPFDMDLEFILSKLPIDIACELEDEFPDTLSNIIYPYKNTVPLPIKTSFITV